MTIRDTLGRLSRRDAETAHRRVERFLNACNPNWESEWTTFNACGMCGGAHVSAHYETTAARVRASVYASGSCEDCRTVRDAWGILDLAISPTTARMNASTAEELAKAFRLDKTDLEDLQRLGALEVTPTRTKPGNTTEDK